MGFGDMCAEQHAKAHFPRRGRAGVVPDIGVRKEGRPAHVFEMGRIRLARRRLQFDT